MPSKPVSANIVFAYYKDLARATDFYARVLGLEMVVDQGFAKIFRVTDQSYIGLVDSEQGTLKASETKPVIIAFVTEEPDGWYDLGVAWEAVGDWGKALGSMPVWNDIDPWRLAVVLDVSKDKATIGLRPGRTPQGVLVKERETGVIPYEEVKWARPKVGLSFGGTPASVNAVLKPGDVVYVSPRLPKPADDGTPGAPDDGLKGQWSLQQIPAVSGALVAMDPHTGRVLAVAGVPGEMAHFYFGGVNGGVWSLAVYTENGSAPALYAPRNQSENGRPAFAPDGWKPGDSRPS